MNSLNFRKLTSLILVFSGLILTFTGLILYITPQGRIAYWNDWQLFGLPKSSYTDIHITISYLFLFFAIVHSIYNGRAIISYITNRATLNTVVALLITVVFCVGTYWKVAPFQSILKLGELLKNYGMDREADPPYGHAELSSMAVVAERTKLELNSVISNLQSNQIQFNDLNEKVLDVARRNKISPRILYLIMSGSNKPSKLPDVGLGKMSLQQASSVLNKDLLFVIKKLEQQGYKVDPEMILKDIADQKNITVHDLREILENL